MAKIITVPNPILRQVSKPVKNLDKKTLKIIKELETTLIAGKNPAGVGLSAIQIGKPIRVLCTYLPPSGDPEDQSQKSVIKTFINPEIIEASNKLTLGGPKSRDQKPTARNPQPVLEGCLSIPGIWSPVWRHTWIKLKWLTKEGKQKQNIFTRFQARDIQHENDHLNGILFTDHSIKNKLPIYKSQKDKLVEIELPYQTSV